MVLDRKIEVLIQSPQQHIRKPGMPENTRYFMHRNGIYVIFEIHENEKEVCLLGALGQHRYYEIAREAEKKPPHP